MSRRIIILTEGHTEPHAGKTAASVIRYRGHEVVALLDAHAEGQERAATCWASAMCRSSASSTTCRRPTRCSWASLRPAARFRRPWRAIILDAIARRKMDVISGLHDFVGDDPEFAAAAKASGVTIYDVRKNTEKTIARRKGLRPDCLRVHAVGHDCSIGKMVVSIEVTNGLKKRGHDAKFIATGQTGIMVEGDGLPIDCIVADFVSGAAEKLVLENQHHDILRRRRAREPRPSVVFRRDAQPACTAVPRRP